MGKKNLLIIGVLSLTLTLSYGQNSIKQNDKKICITVDDLPAVTYGSTNKNIKSEITTKLTETFEKYKVPAIGFVVTGKLYDGESVDSTNLKLIEMWLDRGFDLGNHTYSHFDYNSVSDTAYFNDIIKSQTVLKSLLQKHNKVLKYFRHPYLHSGYDSIRSKSLNDFLSKNNYIAAPVTIDNDDYIFAEAYAIADKENNSSLKREIGVEYINYMEQKLHYFEEKSIEVFNRNITQSLLIHSSLLNADYFDELADMYRKNGYSFVSQDEVFNDPAYSTHVTTYNKQGFSWIFRWGLSKGMNQEIMDNDILVPQKISEILKK
ncbi:MAG: polysaccharide deacetylase family protein [Bacteroidales bacterium]|nr:polysaccharide deacetylase family protein [Bacteroidales bacterium]